MAQSHSGNFIERCISAALSFMKESVFSDEYAHKRGLLQSIDPRVKFVVIMAFLCAVLLAKSITATVYLYFIVVLLAVLSRIDIVFFLKRTWIFIPVFSLFIAIPAIFGAFTPGDPVFGFDIFGLRLVVTRQGLQGAELFVSRVIASVSSVAVLSLTTRHFELLKVLRLCGVPQVFVMIFGMCYRYIYLFSGIIEDTFMAVKSRVGREVQFAKGRHVVTWNMASLWYRSYKLNEDVYSAMLSRGYRGEPVSMRSFKAGLRDWIFLFFAITLCALPLAFRF